MSVYRIKEEIVGERLVLADENSTLSFDGKKQLLSFESIKAFHIQSIALSFSVIEQVRLESRYDKKGLRLTLSFIGQGRRYERELSIAQIDRQEEAADLFFRVATIMGAAGYFVRRSSEIYLDIELLAEAPTEAQGDDPFRSLSYGAHALQEGSTRAVPEVKERANYNDTRGAFKEPAELVGAFEPKDLKNQLEQISFTHYKPGERVALNHEQHKERTKGIDNWEASGLAMSAVIILAMLALGGLLWILFLVPRWAIYIVLPLGVFFLATALILLVQGGDKLFALRVVEEFITLRSLDFSWKTNTVTLRRSEQTRSIPFEDIEGIVLRSIRQNRYSTKGYIHRVVLLLPGPDESLLCAEDNNEYPKSEAALFRFMIEMCRELSIPWRVEVEQAQ